MTDNLLSSLIQHFLETPLFAIGLTLFSFVLGGYFFKKMGKPVWCPAMLLAASFLALFLFGLSISYEEYHSGAQWLSVLIAPTTVALGVPLYQQSHHIRAAWRQILLTVPISASLAVVYAVMIAYSLGSSEQVLASIAPKSVTAPIAIGLTEQLGGSVSLMMGGLLATGVFSVFFVDLLASRLNVTDERLVGLVLGINGHAVGTIRAFEISPVAGAFSSLGMGLTGIFTAIFLPFVWPY